jgi:hypothetical protein
MKWIQIQRRIPDTGALIGRRIWVSERNKYFDWYQKSPAYKVWKKEDREQPKAAGD